MVVPPTPHSPPGHRRPVATLVVLPCVPFFRARHLAGLQSGLPVSHLRLAHVISNIHAHLFTMCATVVPGSPLLVRPFAVPDGGRHFRRLNWPSPLSRSGHSSLYPHPSLHAPRDAHSELWASFCSRPPGRETAVRGEAPELLKRRDWCVLRACAECDQAAPLISCAFLWSCS